MDQVLQVMNRILLVVDPKNVCITLGFKLHLRCTAHNMSERLALVIMLASDSKQKYPSKL